jgi:hypothetical protein
MLAFIMLRAGARGRARLAGTEHESRRKAILTEINGWLREDKPAPAGEARP